MILFGANEDEAIECLSGGMESADMTTYDPTYSRGAIRVHGDPGAQLRYSGDLKAYLDAQPEGDRDFWMSYRLRGGGGFLNGMTGLRMFDATKPYMRLIGPDASSLKLQLSTDGFAASVIDYPFSQRAQPTPHEQWSFRIKEHPTLGAVWWYIGNALFFVTPQGDTTGLITGAPSKTWWSNANSNDQTWISEVMFSTADHPLPGLRLKSIIYVGLGLAGWNGPVGNINELVKNVATAQTTAAANTDESFIPDVLPAFADGIVIHALILSLEARTAAAPAPQHMVGGVRIAGVTYPHPTVRLVDSIAGLLQYIFHVNPAPGRGDAFLVADINALQPVHRSAA